MLSHPEALRARAQEDGYLFFRQLLPRADVMEVRRDILTTLAERAWLEPGTELMDGIVNDREINLVPEDELRVDIGISAEGYSAVQKVHSMHRLPHHPRLIQLFRTLFDESVFVHPRHIIRVATSHRALRPTPPHQDFPLIQGSQNTWTVWGPLGDAPMEIGPLSVLRGSQDKGVIPLGELGTGGFDIGLELCAGETDWLSTDFAAGDILTFPALTIHRAMTATRRDAIRLSMDIRYQPASEPIEEQSLTNHAGVDWDEIYRDWGQTDVQYYWNESTPRLSPWDDSILQYAPVGRRIC
ncbi:MAG: phytanoyl-CoA dioxygenase family protein [Actinobacteria bacterium]|nr:phytanoyl-CoA dioxygenase family protein [Actinomycetota bacterium]